MLSMVDTGDLLSELDQNLALSAFRILTGILSRGQRVLTPRAYLSRMSYGVASAPAHTIAF